MNRPMIVQPTLPIKFDPVKLNSFAGILAGRDTTGINVTAFGYAALVVNSSANDNTAFGYYAGGHLTTGARNTMLGSQAMFTSILCADNVALGYLTLNKDVSAGENTAVGSTALAANTTGVQNTAVGRAALALNTTGTNQTACGAFALGKNISGGWNSAFGRASSWYNTVGSFNAAFGWRTLYSNSTGSYNAAFGTYALHYLQTGSYNVAIGYAADFLFPSSPTATVASGAGLGIGQYTYRVSYVLNGVETIPGDFVNATVTTTSGNQKINLSVIPVYSGPKTCTARKIYRTAVGVENIYQLLTTISDNSTTIYSDTTADASLGAQPTDPTDSIIIGYNARAIHSNQMVVGSDDHWIADVYLGEGIYATSPHDITIHATGGQGTDQAGANLILAGGKNTGSGVGGDVILQGTKAASTGTGEGTLVELMRVRASDGIAVLPIANVGNYANDAAAQTGGVPVGGIYRNGSVLMIRAS